MHRISFVVVCLLFCAGCVTPHVSGKATPAPKRKPVSRGTYVDNEGTKHPWYINQGHTLIWDGEPYYPMGGLVHPPYVFMDGEPGWEMTRAQFDLMEKKGIKDLYFYGPQLPKTLNRAMEYLDARGFRSAIQWGHGLNWGPQVYDLVKGGHTVELITKSGTYGVVH